MKSNSQFAIPTACTPLAWQPSHMLAQATTPRRLLLVSTNLCQKSLNYLITWVSCVKSPSMCSKLVEMQTGYFTLTRITFWVQLGTNDLGTRTVKSPSMSFIEMVSYESSICKLCHSKPHELIVQGGHCWVSYPNSSSCIYNTQMCGIFVQFKTS